MYSQSLAGKQRSNSDDDDARVEKEILQGLHDARNREAKKRMNNQLSPKMCDEFLEESFPKLRPSGQDEAKVLTADEYDALRVGLEGVIRLDVKEKMILLQDQLSEYHSVLEEIIALKSRCERLEQDKKDFVSLCRQECQFRDDNITRLEEELMRLRNTRRSSSSSSCSCSSSNGASIIGNVRAVQYSHGYDHPQDFHYQQIPAASRSQTPRVSDHHHYYNNNEAARMIPLSPSSVPYYLRRSSSSSSSGPSVGTIHPLSFQESSAPVFSKMNEHGGFDDSPCLQRSGENMGTKRHKPS